MATVALPVSDFVPELQSDLRGFTFADGQELVGHIVNVRQLLDTATVDIQADLGGNYSTSTTKGRIDRWFKGNGAGAGHAAPTQAQGETILGVYQFVASDLDSRTVTYRNKGSEAGYEALYGYNDGSGVIDIGALYWDHFDANMNWVEVTAADRFGTIIHELTHTHPDPPLELGVGDNAYFLNPDSLTAPDVVWQWGGVNVIVTTAQLIDNADSYAGFLTQYYYL